MSFKSGPLRCCPSLPRRLKVDKNRARKKLGLLSTARDFFTALHSRRSDREARFDDALTRVVRWKLAQFPRSAAEIAHGGRNPHDTTN